MLVYIGYYEVSMTRKSGGKEYSIKMFCVLARNNKAVSSGTGDKAWEEARKAAGLCEWLKVSREEEESEGPSDF